MGMDILAKAHSRACTPAILLAALFAKKLARKGHKLTKSERDDLRRRCEAVITSGKADALASFSFGRGDGTVNIRFTKRDLDRMFEAQEEALAGTGLFLANQMASRMVRDATKRAPEAWADHAKLATQMNRNVLRTWRRPLQLLALLIRICSDAIYFLDPRLDEEDPPTPLSSKRLEAISRLQGRAVHVANEILVLLAAGYADGAMARWRTLHELAVFALFIEEKDEDVATRYLEYHAVERWHAAKGFQTHAAALGQRRMHKRTFEKLKDQVDALATKYGNEFLLPNGWAAHALGKVGRNAVRFSDIEAVARVSHLRPYYTMANDNVHAGSKGTHLRLGLDMEFGGILLGPSAVGLFDPGYNCAKSLTRATVALLSVHTNYDRGVYMTAIVALQDETVRAFDRAEGQLRGEPPPRRSKSKASVQN